MLSFSEMLEMCNEVNDALAASTFCAIRELDLKKWVLVFGKEGKRIQLLVCALSPFSRFHQRSHRSQEKKQVLQRSWKVC